MSNVGGVVVQRRVTLGNACIVGDDDIVNWSVPGSFDRAALDIAEMPCVEVRALSNTACIVFSVANDIPMENETCVANAVYVWQDTGDRTKSEVLDAFDRALQSLENELYGNYIPKSINKESKMGSKGWSFSFHSWSGILGHRIIGNNLCDENGNPAGGFATDGPGISIKWQDGPVDRENDEIQNGAFVEDILEICRKRLQFYQQSPFACDANAEAIKHIAQATDILERRRQDRRNRGVEGKKCTIKSSLDIIFIRVTMIFNYEST